MSTFSERLTEFFCDDKDMTKEQVHADLHEYGINVDDFMKQIHSTIRKSIQTVHREQVAHERAEFMVAMDNTREKILAFPADKLQQIINDATNGRFGKAGQDLAIACRNKTDKEPSLEELRALVQDILAITERENETK